MTHDTDTFYDDTEPQTSNGKATVGITLLSLLMLIVGLVIGRATADIGMADIRHVFSTEKPKVRVHVVYKTLRVPVKPQAAAVPPAKDSTATHAAKPKAEPEKAQTEDADPYARYNADQRLRFGAYRIVGVQQTVTVVKGQTLGSIAKAHLGPGMECYMEVMNGTAEVKEGQKIKIPQLRTKKSLRKRQ